MSKLSDVFAHHCRAGERVGINGTSDFQLYRRVAATNRFLLAFAKCFSDPRNIAEKQTATIGKGLDLNIVEFIGAAQ